MVSSCTERAMISRASANDPTCPNAIACTNMFPAAVASTGPTTTGNCNAFAVK